MALGLLWAANIAVAAATIALLGLMLYVYGRNWRAVRSRFAIGLIAFTGFLLAEVLGMILLYFWMGNIPEYGPMAAPMLMVNSAQFLGFVALFAITWD